MINIEIIIYFVQTSFNHKNSLNELNILYISIKFIHSIK